MTESAWLAARVRGMMGRLLPPAILNRLQGAEDLQQALEGTPYDPHLPSHAPAEVLLPRVMETLHQHLSDSFVAVHRLAPPHMQPLVQALQVRWDVHNLLALWRGVQHNAPSADILEAVVPTAAWPLPVLAELSRQPTLAALQKTLAVWGGEWWDSEPMVARSLYRKARSQVRPGERGVHAWLDDQVDAVHILIALRAAARGERGFPEDRFIEPGGSLGLKQLQQVTRGDRTLPGLTPARTLMDAEWQLERTLLQRTDRFMRADPLGPGLVAGFLAQQAHEATRLRAILRHRLLRLPASDRLLEGVRG